MKTIVKASLIVLVLFLLSACSGPREQPRAQSNQEVIPAQQHQQAMTESASVQEGGILYYNLKAEPITLNPILLTDAYSLFVVYLIYEALVDVNQQLELVPRLASSWEFSDQSCKLTFHLRPDVTWHDGHKFTARDVVFTYGRAMDDSVAAYRSSGAFDMVDHIEAVDELTVDVYYKGPYAPALQSWSTLMIMPEHIYEKEEFMTSPYNRKPIGTGPFRFEEWNVGKHLKVKANENYWYGRPILDGIFFRMITADTIAYRSLLEGDIHGLEVTPTIWSKFMKSAQDRQKINSFKMPTLNYSVIAWNADGSNPFFTEMNLRRAMTLAIDRTSIIKKLLLGLADICTGPFSPYSWGYDHTVKPYPFDLEQARQIIDLAGWTDTDHDGIRDKNGSALKFTLMIQNNNRQIEQIASMVQFNLEKLGIIMEIARFENAAFIDNLMKKNFQAALVSLNLSVDPDAYQILHSSQIKAGFNLTSYKNSDVDTLLEQARSVFDQEMRTQFYHKIHQIIHTEQPYTFLFTQPQLFLFDKRVKNIKASPQPLYLYFPGILDWSLTNE
ncbi:peptide-binding protein [bacterium]|nr:peptide-binding protein [bacterium]